MILSQQRAVPFTVISKAAHKEKDHSQKKWLEKAYMLLIKHWGHFACFYNALERLMFDEDWINNPAIQSNGFNLTFNLTVMNKCQDK